MTAHVEPVEIPSDGFCRRFRPGDRTTTITIREHAPPWVPGFIRDYMSGVPRELARDNVLTGNYAAECIASEFDLDAPECPDCHGTGKYQPLIGPVEPCKTCDGEAGK